LHFVLELTYAIIDAGIKTALIPKYMKSRIPYSKPSITELEVKYATDAATYGWGDQCYKYINRFEELFKEHLDVKFAIATSSCTGALHMGMAALGVGPGDEVILADTNWIATAAPVVHLGAKPVFVDILPDSWCIDPEKVESVITPLTKAIIAVHLYGNLCDMDRLIAIGKKYDCLIGHSEKLPPNWTTVYEVSKLTEEQIESLIDRGVLTASLIASDLNAALGKEKKVKAKIPAPIPAPIPNGNDEGLGFRVQLGSNPDREMAKKIKNLIGELKKLNLQLQVGPTLEAFFETE
jgi:hypothetical protein